MALDLTREPAIPLSDVPKLPWLGRRISISTVHRWCTRGIRGHRLEYIQVGGTRVTTEGALRRFFQVLAADRTPSEQEPCVNQTKAMRSVERALDLEGV